MRHFLRIWFLLFGVGLMAQGQNIPLQKVRIQGLFLQDSAKIGSTVQFRLKAIHPENVEIVFPDSGWSFEPFELIDKEYFTTQTQKGLSTDSAIYVLNTFNTDSVQKLSLPVWVLNGKDSIQVWGQGDSLIFKSVLPDTLKIATAPYLPDEHTPTIAPRFNYWIWGFGGFTLIFLFSLTWRYLKKPVQKALRLFTLYRRHQTFVVNFERLSQQVRREKTPIRMEAVLALWKLYLERLEDIPYTSFTSREILQVLPSEELANSLDESDRWIYGGIVVEDPAPIFLNLKNLAQVRYNNRRNEVRNG